MSPEFRVRDFPDIKIFWMIYFMIADLEIIIIRRCGINHENMRYTRDQGTDGIHFLFSASCSAGTASHSRES